jgi:MFS family permease
MGASFFLALLAIFVVGLFFLLDWRYKFTYKELPATPFTCSAILKFPFSFWCCLAIKCFSSCSIYVVLSFGPSFLVDKGFTEVQAGLVIAAMNIFVLLSPLTSWIIDKFGHRCLIWGSCQAVMVICFFLLAFSVSSPMIWLLLIGFVFAILAPSVYASFPLIVDEGALGTAYGKFNPSTSIILVWPIHLHTLDGKDGYIPERQKLSSFLRFNTPHLKSTATRNLENFGATETKKNPFPVLALRISFSILGFVALTFNFGLLVYPLVIGALMTKYHMWMYVHFFFAGTNTLGFLACVLIYCTDKQNIFMVPVSQIKKGYEIIGDSEHELSEQ